MHMSITCVNMHLVTGIFAEREAMCINAGELPDGTKIPCRECWQCRERKVDDWVGRCIAESKTSKDAHFITLTYGRDENNESDHLRSAVLTYSDVQKYFKLLRFRGYKFRYLVVGEYGSMKGRSHWHLIMYWKNKVPPHELSVAGNDIRFNNDSWPAGFQQWQKVTPETVRYICKYINKDIGKDERQAHMSMSKKPPLGFDYFNDLAMRYVEQGLAPQTFEYSFPEYKKGGKKKVFYMAGTTAKNFISQYLSLWSVHKDGHAPYSPIVEKYEDALARGSTIQPRDTFYKYLRTPNGSPVKQAKDPETGYMGLYYVDDFDYWNWYRYDDERSEYQWQRETITQKMERCP